MSTARKCRFCQGKIHPGKHGSAAYCSDEHSYEARKLRSKARYHGIRKDFIEKKKNENILAQLYWMKNHLKKEVSYSDLERLKFNFGYSSAQKMTPSGLIWNIVGEYGYYIDPKTKKIDLWKKS